MSFYRSEIGESWTLRSAVDALSGAARRAGRPGWIWIAGFAYPTFGVYGIDLLLQGLINQRGYADENRWQFDFGSSGIAPLFMGMVDDGVEVPVALLASAVIILLMLPLYRLAVGLARVCSPKNWELLSNERGHPSLSNAWRSGKGMALSSAGLHIQVLLMFLLAFVLCAGPAYFLIDTMDLHRGPLLLFVLSPALFLLIVYGAVLSGLIQLGLHSLAQNRRGVASALLHAWRLARRDPWATARTMAVDGVLIVASLALTALILVLAVPTCGLGFLLIPVLAGFIGLTRAGYWAGAYRALGGLSPDDGIPGLEAAEA